jgi:deoxyuridine 5'-triphosphate nucleotidohydrolase
MKLSKIKSIKKEIKQTFDISVRNNHNFFCNNHLIHNCDYRGELGIILINLSDVPVLINDGDRIAQIIISKHETVQWEPVDELGSTERGEGGFGHTGK